MKVKLNKKFLYYLAGFFDGEGYAGTVKVANNLWKPRICLSNTNKKVMEQIFNLIKIGKLYVYKYGNKKTQWRIDIFTPKDIILFCDLIINKTIIKTKPLKIIRNFSNYLEKTKNKHHTYTGKKAGWNDKDISFIQRKFVIPVSKLIKNSNNKEINYINIERKNGRSTICV